RLYSETWFDNSDNPARFEDILSTDKPITTNGFVITKQHAVSLGNTIRKHSQKYVRPDSKGIISAPFDFILLSSVPNVLRVTSSSLFNAGQMNVVQIYNMTRLVKNAPRPKVGDFMNSSMVIDEILNSPYGRKISFTCTAFCNEKPIGLFQGALISRNNPVSHSMAFQKLRDQRYTVFLKTIVDVAVLEAKEWFCYTGAVQNLAPMSTVEFHIDSHYRFKSDTVYSSIQTTGHVYLKPTRGKPVLIGKVDFVWGEAVADPVIEYLKRHSLGSNAVLFDDGGYAIIPQAGESQLITAAPKTNSECAWISGDYNPIHTNPYIADIAGLPGTITHGVWISLAVRAITESCAADGQSDCMLSFDTDFIDMVLPGDKLNTKLQHVGMVDGRMLVNSKMFNQNGDMVLKCSAEIEQPKTAYVFTGQGSQEVGMGMALYVQSDVARDVWDRADRHIKTTYGISILDIVRRNPKELTVYFGGEFGQAILGNYMALTREDFAKNAVGSVVSLFPEINVDSECFTFVSPTGLLNSTQFTQVALVVFSMAAMADMRAKGLVQKGAAFAGHSLGEYCALATLSDIFTLEDVLDIVFYRGLVMQSVVERDNQGNSQYGMVAVNPSRVGSWFGETELAAVIAGIAEQDSNRGLIEVVNFNVRGEQYVVAGSLPQLSALRMVLHRLATNTDKSDDNTKQRIQSAVEAVFAMGPISADEQPQRGQATVPLAGIDVPFHSSLLRRGVSSFRSILKQRICSEFVDCKQLIWQYIPNLTAAPFEVSKSYFERVYQITGSSVIGDILEDWSDNEEIAEDSDKAAELAAALVIELLAYQFASP
ncbi:fatty acid synthase alpha subunit Lsd1, partial [Coemansia sp. RSA 485]